jgi:hypothetical protein
MLAVKTDDCPEEVSDVSDRHGKLFYFNVN